MANIGAAKLLESLLASEEQIRSLMANIPEVVWKVDAQGNVIFISAAVRQYLVTVRLNSMNRGSLFGLMQSLPRIAIASNGDSKRC
ncbi:MAG: hypothetical protein NVS1B11_26570 [Terriglobales bacterium]